MKGWGELQQDVPLWLNRTDDFSAQLGVWASLFEAKAGRLLRTRAQETAFSGTIDGNSQIALPADWLAFKTLWIVGQEGSPLTPQTLEAVVARNRTTGSPVMYAVTGANVQFDGVGDVLGVYHAALPNIETNSTNWLSALAYDAYLFGMLSEAWGYLMNDAQEAKYAARSMEALNSVIAADQRDRFTGPLVARKR